MLDLDLSPGTEAPARARRSLEIVARDLDPDVRDWLRLLITELVTNSIRHGDLGPADTVRVRISRRDETIRAEVTDSGRGFDPALRDPAGDRASGWGLYLLDRVADRWGVVDDGRTRVWFELRRA